MAAQGHIMTWGSHAGRHTGGMRWHWLQRIGQWLTGYTASNSRTSTTTVYGTWDGRREQMRPITSESALDHVAAQGGQSWSITMHSVAL
jgi:hypothetical protein